MKKFYLTTSIAYVNASPHLGFALESAQADLVARYYRQRGHDVFFLTGTDEHGVKIIRAAEGAGEPLPLFVDNISKKFMALKQALNLSYDDFIRTSDQERHWPAAQKLWRQLVENGDIYKARYRGLYCVGHEAFVTEKDLIDGKCRDHNQEPETIEEENWFFRLSKYSKEIESRIKNNELRIIPETRKNEALAWIKEGLEDISFSRPRKDLSWGIPVPDDDTQTMYVWCDALANYVSAIGYGDSKPYTLNPKSFDHWWPADLHIIGKDILRFHALIWPAMLMSAKLPLPKQIFVHGHITVEGRKMSKTIGNIIDPFELVKKYGRDAVRYYLLREIPAHEDGDFSYKKFEDRYSGDLANGLGNFAARVLALGEGIGKMEIELGKDIDKEVALKIKAVKMKVEEMMNEYRFHEAMAAIWDLIAFGDKYVDRTKVWRIKDAKLKSKTIFNLVTILDNVGAMLLPFLPETSEKITKNINWRTKDILEVKRGEILFPRLK